MRGNDRLVVGLGEHTNEGKYYKGIDGWIDRPDQIRTWAL